MGGTASVDALVNANLSTVVDMTNAFYETYISENELTQNQIQNLDVTVIGASLSGNCSINFTQESKQSMNLQLDHQNEFASLYAGSDADKFEAIADSLTDQLKAAIQAANLDIDLDVGGGATDLDLTTFLSQSLKYTAYTAASKSVSSFVSGGQDNNQNMTITFLGLSCGDNASVNISQNNVQDITVDSIIVNQFANIQSGTGWGEGGQDMDDFIASRNDLGTPGENLEFLETLNATIKKIQEDAIAINQTYDIAFGSGLGLVTIMFVAGLFWVTFNPSHQENKDLDDTGTTLVVSGNAKYFAFIAAWLIVTGTIIAVWAMLKSQLPISRKLGSNPLQYFTGIGQTPQSNGFLVTDLERIYTNSGTTI